MSDTRTMSLYDAAGQTTVVRSPNSQSVTFTYTAAGQRRSMDATNSGRSTYTYDPANQLKYGQVTAGRTTYTYDLTGNQRIEQPPTGNRTTTTWNYENQPTQYRLPSGLPVTMAYNGDNRRISLVQGTSTTKFVWDPVIDAYIQELNGSNVLIASYTSEPQQYGGVLSQRRGSTSRFLHADALGTARLLTTSAGATSDTYLYNAWGNSVASTGTNVNPYRWIGGYGYYTDSATGLVYVRAIMYMPTVAMWCSVDPLLYRDSLNLFQISHNSVLNRIDPSGLCTVCGIKAVNEGSFAELDKEFVAGQEPFSRGAETWQNIYEDDPVMRSRRLNFGSIQGAGTWTSTNMTDVTINGSMWPTRSIHAIGHLLYLVAYIKSVCGNASDCRVVLREDGQTWHWRDVFGRQRDSRWAKIWGSRMVDDLIYRGDSPPQLPIPVGVSGKLSMGDLINPLLKAVTRRSL